MIDSNPGDHGEELEQEIKRHRERYKRNLRKAEAAHGLSRQKYLARAKKERKLCDDKMRVSSQDE